MTMTKAASYLLVLATVLSLAACADGGMGTQQQGSASNQQKAVIPPSNGGY
jgi:hypothetical protein